MVTFNYRKPIRFTRSTFYHIAHPVIIDNSYYGSYVTVNSRKELKAVYKQFIKIANILSRSKIVVIGRFDTEIEAYVRIYRKQMYYDIPISIVANNVSHNGKLLDYINYSGDVYGNVRVAYSCSTKRWWTYIPLIGRILK